MLLWCASSRATVAGGRRVGVDAAALAFLLAQSLRLQEVEAEERMEEEERQQREAEEEELVDRHAEQLALVRLDRLGSPAQTARLLVATRRKAVLTLSAKARRKKKKKRGGGGSGGGGRGLGVVCVSPEEYRYWCFCWLGSTVDTNLRQFAELLKKLTLPL